MKNIKLIYIGDYGRQEEETLKELGVSSTRIESIEAIETIPWQNVKQLTIVRSARVKIKEYEKMFSDLNTRNLLLINNPELFTLHGSFELYYSMIKTFSPKSIFLAKGSTVSEIKNEITASNLSSPLFVRSEIESAAKYVGIEGCLIKVNTETEISKCVSNLDNNVTNYQNIIIKEVIEIKKSQHDKNLEYRAIVINDRIISFDYDADKIPSPLDGKIANEAQNIVSNIYNNGFKGAYFMDFALTANDNVIIVESKDILNGTIKDLTSFGKGLLT
jgi:hypothetical protein